ncbi:MAG: MazG family protein [Chloroflexia bacterium]|nr:MazG family protein [Chloroflexia bacterium]
MGGGYLTIIGLGPGDPRARTIGAQQVIDAASTIILRTAIHPGLDDLLGDSRVVTCDDLYERAEAFDDLYRAIAARVCAASQSATVGEVVYAVPGHPRFGERSVGDVIERAAVAGIAVRVLDAVSAVDSVATLLGIDPMAEDLQMLDGAALAAVANEEPFSGGRVVFSPLRPVLVSQVYSRAVASGVKLALSRLLPDNHPVKIVRAASVSSAATVVDAALYELDHWNVDHLTSIWAPALGTLEAGRDPRTLQHVVARLRAPGGCPWDRQQTHATLRDAVIDEAHEVVDAIDADDAENLAEELGDLFLLVAMHAQLAEERGTFTLEDVFEGIARKIVRRHPHVFGNHAAEDAAAVVRTWNQVKAEEKASRSTPARAKAADGQPHSMPALTRARRVLKLHPYIEGVEAPADAGEVLLAAVARVIDAGGDPDTILRAALTRHVARHEEISTNQPDSARVR